MKAHSIRSEITGTVWKILAGTGDAVAAEQELLILESMKMEIPATAPVAGIVQRILVAEGDVVEEGQELVVIEVRAAG